MFRYHRKWLASVIVAGLTLTSAACSSGGDQEAASSQQPVVQESAKPKPVLKSLNPWQKEDYNTYPVAKLLEERTGYKVQYDMLPQDKPLDKLNLIIASGDQYDAVTTMGGSNEKAVYSEYARRGALLELTDLIDKYGPNIKASISPESFEAMKVNGKLYGIPFKGVEFTTYSILIRQDWLDKLKLKMPATTNELVEVLRQFKEKDPGGNGEKNIPMTLQGGLPFVDNIVGAFGIPYGWNDVNGSMVPRVMDPAFKEYATFMNSLYKDGLIDKEFAINKDATAKEKFTSGMAGALQVGWFDLPGLLDSLTKNKPEAKAVYIPALKGPAGKSGFSMNSGFDRITFIPKSSKNPEDAIKWMDAKLEKETFKKMVIGEEGKHYTYKDGAYTPILPIFTDERNQAVNYITGVDEKNYPIYWQARVRKDPRLFEGWEFLNIKQGAARISDKLGLAPYLPEHAKNNAPLNTLSNDYLVKLIVGAEQISGLEAFQQKFKSSGGEASVKEINDWYKTIVKK
jgi:putative aldouronate transport system substrate-binding protein